MENLSYHVQVLNEEFARRSKRNTRYSLRAFAAHLQMHPSALSRILSGKQRLSKSSALEVTKKLSMCNETSRLFLQSVVDEQHKLGVQELGEAVAIPELKVQPIAINEKDHDVMARVLCLCIRELTLTQDFQPDPNWIAERCGGSVEEVKTCLEALLRVGLIEIKGGTYVHTMRHLTAVNSKETSATRIRLQREIAEKGMESVTKVPFERRGHYGMTMAVDPARIPAANKKILEFMESLCDFLEMGDRREVYQLSVQLFPLTNRDQNSGGMP